MVTTVFSKIILQCRKYNSRVKSCKFFMVQLITILFEKVKPFIKKQPFANFSIFTGKQLCWSLQACNFIKKRL